MISNLLLHGIGWPRRPLESGESSVWISAKQMNLILDMVTDSPVELSVDDGNSSDVEVLLPALLERNLNATFFPIVGRLNKPGYLSDSALLELRDAGMRIGSHGMNHRNWRKLEPSSAYEELVKARCMLEDLLHARVDLAACPYGQYGRRSLRYLSRYGYRRVYTSDGSASKPDAWIQARTSVRPWHDPRDLRTAIDEQPPLGRQLATAAKRGLKRLR